jgi:hypothetical protein
MKRLKTPFPISGLTAGMGNGEDLDLTPSPLTIDQSERKMSEEETASRVWAFRPALR